MGRPPLPPEKKASVVRTFRLRPDEWALANEVARITRKDSLSDLFVFLIEYWIGPEAQWGKPRTPHAKAAWSQLRSGQPRPPALAPAKSPLVPGVVVQHMGEQWLVLMASDRVRLIGLDRSIEVRLYPGQVQKVVPVVPRFRSRDAHRRAMAALDNYVLLKVHTPEFSLWDYYALRARIRKL